MSNPPSPPRTQPFERPSVTANIPTSSIPTAGGPVSTFAPALATTLPTAQATQPPAFAHQPFAGEPHSFNPPLAPAAQITSFQQPSAFQGVSSSFGATSLASAAGPSTRGGRRSKTHVASACVNCKRAHLSCDVQRPCARCVASGKQDTCVDVQHKKRGRPRLREESDFRAQQMIPEEESPEQGSIVAGPTQPPTRPIAGARRARAESFRSLQSQGSEESGPSSITGSTPGRGAASMFSPYSVRQAPTSSAGPPAFEIATALLNTDFVIIRANKPFEHIIWGGRNVRDRNIGELASPADGESFQNIRNRLRAEREDREPAYMPPIIQPSQDPVLQIPETEAEQYAQGFNDHTYRWRQRQLGPAAETFPARVRLAKATAYFVVITLPSFRPVEQPPTQPSHAPPFTYSGPLMVGPPLPFPEASVPAREPTTQSAPPMVPFSFQGPVPPMPPAPSAPRFASSRTYPPPQPPISFQQQAHPSYQPAASMTPRLPAREPPVEASPFTPRSAPVDVGQPVGTAALQLPPIAISPAVGAAGLSTVQGAGDGSSEEEEEGGRRLRSPRKRRRMGIDDVLQR